MQIKPGMPPLTMVNIWTVHDATSNINFSQR